MRIVVVVSTGDAPYQILGAENNWEVRYFKNEDPTQLFWHRDKETREIELIWGDIEIQMDNLLPVKLVEGQSYFVPEERYHRVIADKSFIIRIYKY